jgi:protein-S-isoprenylcysteine O-methyltransferase Ste14
MILGFREFRRHRTSFSTRDPSTVVLRSGPYAWSRNPLYIGLTGISVGVGLDLDRGWVLAMLVPALWVMHVGVIFREERYLEAKFGDEYRAYRADVRRWFGRRKP